LLKSGGDEIGIDKAQAEYSVACLPEHQLALSRARKHVLDNLRMLFDPVWDRTVADTDRWFTDEPAFDSSLEQRFDSARKNLQ
jgi:hypothetical protein